MNIARQGDSNRPLIHLKTKLVNGTDVKENLSEINFFLNFFHNFYGMRICEISSLVIFP